MSVKKVNFDTLRSIAFGDISGMYAAIGTALTVLPRIVCITNDTNAGMIISDDNANSVGKLYIPAGGFKLFDLTANMDSNKDDSLVMEIGTIMYVKQVTAPTSGGVYLEYIYGT